MKAGLNESFIKIITNKIKNNNNLKSKPRFYKAFIIIEKLLQLDDCCSYEWQVQWFIKFKAFLKNSY